MNSSNEWHVELCLAHDGCFLPSFKRNFRNHAEKGQLNSILFKAREGRERRRSEHVKVMDGDLPPLKMAKIEERREEK